MNIIPIFILHPLTTSGFHHIYTSQSIFIANQLNGFYMMENIGCKWVNKAIICDN